MSNSITAQRINYINDCTDKDKFYNLVAAFDKIYGDKMPPELQKAIDEKSKQIKN
jgi:hypothetical protein